MPATIPPIAYAHFVGGHIVCDAGLFESFAVHYTEIIFKNKKKTREFLQRNVIRRSPRLIEKKLKAKEKLSKRKRTRTRVCRSYSTISETSPGELIPSMPLSSLKRKRKMELANAELFGILPDQQPVEEVIVLKDDPSDCEMEEVTVDASEIENVLSNEFLNVEIRQEEESICSTEAAKQGEDVDQPFIEVEADMNQDYGFYDGPHTPQTPPPAMPSNMPPCMMPNMPPNMIPNMPPYMMPNMPPNMIPNMPPCMMPNMPPNMIPNMPPCMMPNMPPNMIPNMSPNCFPFAQFLHKLTCDSLATHSPNDPFTLPQSVTLENTVQFHLRVEVNSLDFGQVPVQNFDGNNNYAFGEPQQPSTEPVYHEGFMYVPEPRTAQEPTVKQQTSPQADIIPEHGQSSDKQYFTTFNAVPRESWHPNDFRTEMTMNQPKMDETLDEKYDIKPPELDDDVVEHIDIDSSSDEEEDLASSDHRRHQTIPPKNSLQQNDPEYDSSNIPEEPIASFECIPNKLQHSDTSSNAKTTRSNIRLRNDLTNSRPSIPVNNRVVFSNEQSVIHTTTV